MIVTILVLVLAADQWTKYLVKNHFDYGETIPVWPGCFNLTYIGNTGAAWGMFPGQNQALILLSIVTVVVMFVFRKSFAIATPLQKIAVGLVLGGIFGNLLDRIFEGHVIDFLDFYWIVGGTERHWPAFNIADTGICVGAFLYLFCALWQPKSKAAAEPAAAVASQPSRGRSGFGPGAA